MRISCFPKTEDQLGGITERLRQLGLGNQYEEQAHGENVLIEVRTRSLLERDMVTSILREAGISELFYGEETAA